MKELEKDGMVESMKSELDALGKRIDIEKEEFLRMKKAELFLSLRRRWLRNYYQEAGVKIRLRYDDQLREALRQTSGEVLIH